MIKKIILQQSSAQWLTEDVKQNENRLRLIFRSGLCTDDCLKDLEQSVKASFMVKSVPHMRVRQQQHQNKEFPLKSINTG